MNDDPFDLTRFVLAQDQQYQDALQELRAGRKQSHWIWFVFPQLRALGRSGMARLYGLENLQEAQAYWAHPMLGKRLLDGVAAMLSTPGKSAAAILGDIDAVKYRSCLTLFLQAAPGQPELSAALDRFYSAEPDPLTLALLGRDGEA